MKSKLTIIAVVALVLGVLYVGDRNRWFRQVKAQSSPAPQVECDRLRTQGDPGARACYQRLTQSRDPFARAEGYWGLGDLYKANDEFRAANDAVKNDPVRRVRWGQLFVATDLAGDGLDIINEALKIDPENVQAMLAKAQVLAEDYDAEGVKIAEQALMLDPKLYQARELMARVQLEDGYPEKAAEEAKKALEINPKAPQALAILATVDQMADKPGTEWLDRIFNENPKYAEAYETMAHFFIINRRYDEGIALYRKALDLRPDLWDARAQLGVNLMRFGIEDEGRQQLERTYNDGPMPSRAIVRNSLKLLDTLGTFETLTGPRTILKVDKKESAVLAPYFQQEMERASETYEKKYKFKLKQPIRVEVYPDHADFEVRTMGLPGLGALGVTFGHVVAMDSPNSRTPGEFHWAATLWHELSHVYVLNMTDSRVPRWFTEGLAVYEETAISPEWGDRMTPREIKAIKEKKLLGIADLDRGFVHPTYPEQVIVSYFQGGRVLTFIVEKWGFDAVLAMIEGFKQRKDTVTVVKEVLKVTPEEFDKQFFPWLEADTKKTVEGFDTWSATMKGLTDAASKKQWDTVIADAPKAIDIYPDFIEGGSAYGMLLRAYEEKGDKAKMIATLEQYATHGGRSPAALKQLADLQAEAGNKKAAMSALEKLNFIYPKDDQSHQKLGGWLLEQGDSKGAIREFKAALGSGQINKADAHYNLARAYRANKQTDEALEEVYQSLEAAPTFKPALQLLLELNANPAPAAAPKPVLN